MVLITKSDIKNGKEDRHEVFIPLLNEEVSLRPLTDREYEKVMALGKDLGDMSMDMKESGTDNTGDENQKQEREIKATINPKIQHEANTNANYLCAAFGLSNENETFVPSDLYDMRPVGVVAQIAEAVVMISKIQDLKELEKAIKDFRKQ